MSEGLKGIPKIDDERLSEIGEAPIKLAARQGSDEWYIDVNDYENIFTMVEGIPELIAEIKRLKAELARHDAQMEEAIVEAKAGECWIKNL